MDATQCNDCKSTGHRSKKYSTVLLQAAVARPEHSLIGIEITRYRSHSGIHASPTLDIRPMNIEAALLCGFMCMRKGEETLQRKTIEEPNLTHCFCTWLSCDLTSR